MRNAATAQETFLSEANPGPFATTVAELRAVGFRPSSGANYYGGSFAMTVSAVASNSYCLTARSGHGNVHRAEQQPGLGDQDDADRPRDLHLNLADPDA